MCAPFINWAKKYNGFPLNGLYIGMLNHFFWPSPQLINRWYFLHDVMDFISFFQRDLMNSIRTVQSVKQTKMMKENQTRKIIMTNTSLNYMIT
jgi:hypothetical protein